MSILDIKTKEINYFAKTNFRNTEQIFGIKRADRRQHMYVIGKSGVGKSAMLHNLIIQDIHNDEGVCVVDPHGELIEDILNKIPASRKDDVIYFNPADDEYSVGFNPFELNNKKHKHLVASGLMAIFTKIWSNVWSARMEYILNNTILALLDTPGTTLLGIPRLLTDKEYRQEIINNLEDPVVKAFWVNEYEQWNDKFRNEAIAPIQNKVGQFLSTSMVRNIVGQPSSTIDIFDIMNSKKILLINVSKGRIGEDNSALLGAMLITKIQLAAMERVRIPENEREDFYLYVDEFQNFATDSFASVLSEARKYRLNLIIAHQYTGQLVTDNSTKVRDAIFGNAGTMVVFRVGVTDAEFLENEYAPVFDIQDMVNLPNWNIYLKLLIDGKNSKPFSAQTLPPIDTEKIETLSEQEIIKLSRKNWAKKSTEIEASILAWAAGKETSKIAYQKYLKEKEKNTNLKTKKNQTTNNKPKDNLYHLKCAICGKHLISKTKPKNINKVLCRACQAKNVTTKISNHLNTFQKNTSFQQQTKPPVNNSNNNHPSDKNLSAIGIGISDN